MTFRYDLCAWCGTACGAQLCQSAVCGATAPYRGLGSPDDRLTGAQLASIAHDADMAGLYKCGECEWGKVYCTHVGHLMREIESQRQDTAAANARAAAAEAERDAVAAYRDAAWMERDRARAERDRLRQEVAVHTPERQDALTILARLEEVECDTREIARAFVGPCPFSPPCGRPVPSSFCGHCHQVVVLEDVLDDVVDRAKRAEAERDRLADAAGEAITYLADGAVSGTPDAARDAEQWLRSALAGVASKAPSALASMTAERDRLAVFIADLGVEDVPCRCGSGGHPRRCKRHPDRYDLHIAEWEHELAVADRETLERERDRLAAELARVTAERATLADLTATFAKVCVDDAGFRVSAKEANARMHDELRGLWAENRALKDHAEWAERLAADAMREGLAECALLRSFWMDEIGRSLETEDAVGWYRALAARAMKHGLRECTRLRYRLYEAQDAATEAVEALRDVSHDAALVQRRDRGALDAERATSARLRAALVAARDYVAVPVGESLPPEWPLLAQIDAALWDDGGAGKDGG